MTPPLRHTDVMKLAVGPKKAKDIQFSVWDTILSEIVVGDAFGVDRMDYLLRDSHHAGVAYGQFDHYRLIDTLRILPTAPIENHDDSDEPALGVEEGGIQSAEALMLARYFMYSQVYFHPIRRVYDIHLKDFLSAWLNDGAFSVAIESHLAMTDNEVTAALLQAAFDENKPGHTHARRIMRREHFKLLYERSPSDIQINPEAGSAIFAAAQERFGAEYFRHDRYLQKSGAPDFPVRMRSGEVASSLVVSKTLNDVPVVSVDFVFSDRSKIAEVATWLSKNRNDIIKPKEEEADDGPT